jgi:hypothetical protein
MFPHEEYLKMAIEDCQISKLVDDLGGLYVGIVAKNEDATDEEFQVALNVYKILQKASEEIAALGPKPQIPHPRDKKPEE